MDRFGDTVGPAEAVDVDNFNVNTLEDDVMAGGWTPVTKPSGTTPPRATVAGSRGESNMDSDNKAGPGDQSSYGER